jgi:CheY-like chemotaxis protein
MNVAQLAQEPKIRRRILVVDDNLDNVRSLAMLFDTMGHQVDYAINATVVIDLAQRFQPDIVFLDLLLPDDHGAEFAGELRALPELKQTRIIAVTASSHMLDHQIAL